MRWVFHRHALVPSLVVVHQINIERVAVDKAEHNPPVAGYRSAPRALQVALESVETIARQVEVGRALRSIQVTQNVGDPARLIGAKWDWTPT